MVTASNGNVDRRLTTLYIAQPPQLLNRLHATHSIIRPHRPYYTYVDGGLLLQTEYCGLGRTMHLMRIQLPMKRGNYKGEVGGPL